MSLKAARERFRTATRKFVAVSQLGYSPDGAALAYLAAIRPPGVPSAQRKLVIVTPGSAAPRLLEASPDFAGGDPQFTTDGTAVAYTVRDKGGDNLRLQPLDGSAPRMITEFATGHIVRFRWSPDRTKLALLRENIDSDVVLLRDAASEPGAVGRTVRRSFVLGL